MEINFNKQLLKKLLKLNEINNYRYYLIVKHYFTQRSGLFSLDELSDILHQHYGYKSLSRLSGNDRNNFKRRLEDSFNKSILFIRCTDGRYRIVSEKKLCPERTSKYICKHDDLRSARAFKDIVIGIISIGHFNSARSLQERTGYSRSRIYRAVKRNDSRGRIKKLNNFIIPDISIQKNKTSARDFQKYLFKEFNIISRVLNVRSQDLLCLYLSNTYLYNDGIDYESKRCPLKKSEAFPYTPVKTASDKYNLWMFKDKSGLESYIERFSA